MMMMMVCNGLHCWDSAGLRLLLSHSLLFDSINKETSDWRWGNENWSILSLRMNLRCD